MNTPFENDPLCYVWMAFKRLYPDKSCRVCWDAGLKDDDGKLCYGITTFCDDGEIIVTIDAGQAVCTAVETLAHELAHVATGKNAGHDAKFNEAFNAIYDEYVRIGDELQPEAQLKIVEIIGETVRVKDAEDGDPHA